MIKWIIFVFLCIWGIPQIIGSIKTRQKGFWLTILIWLILLGCYYYFLLR